MVDVISQVYILAGGILTPLENMKVSWGDYSQCMEKWKRFETTSQNMKSVKFSEA